MIRGEKDLTREETGRIRDKIFALAFTPAQWVQITFCGVNYRGRIVHCKILRHAVHVYQVQYVDDSGTLKYEDFHEDEIQEFDAG